MIKFNISEKNGKTFHVESETENLFGKELGQKCGGLDVNPELSGYEFEIAGASDKAGFPVLKEVEGIILRKVLLGYGVGMKRRSRREGKRKRSSFTPNGLRLRKTARGKILSSEIMQINLKILKEGSKKLSEIFPEQNLPKQKAEAPAAT